MEKKTIETNKELEMAWHFVENTGTNIFLTGKAGTGKTTFLRELKKNSPKNMVVLAPTGIAAINAGGVTIHSFFQLPLSPYIPGTSFHTSDDKRYQFSKKKKELIKSIDLLVIDEISMVRADLLDAVDSVMRRYRAAHHLPFGGAQLLLIGDLQQLAPVVTPETWEMMRGYYETPYFFSSHALNMTPYVNIELQKVYRQQDPLFLNLLNKIRANEADDRTLAELNKRYIPDFTPPKDSDYIILTTHNKPADDINDEKLRSIDEDAFYYTADVSGTFPETSYPAEETLVLKKGAQVMFIKNDSKGLGRYYNGMVAEITAIDGNYIKVKPKEGGNEFFIDQEKWTNSKYILNTSTNEIEEVVEGEFKQFPLRLAWAITIHKSQGLAFNHAIIDVSHSFAHGQAYVALSRCKSLEGMVLSEPITSDAIINDSCVDNFNKSAEAARPTMETLHAQEINYVAELLDELFSLAECQQSAESLYRTMAEHMYKRFPTLVENFRDMSAFLKKQMQISAAFHNQYVNMLIANADINAADLQERIHKGAAYFLEQLKPLVATINTTKPNITNKSVKTIFDDKKAALMSAISIKIQLLSYERNENVKFTPRDYLKRKAKILNK
ncbi:MAG: AAA family ATPase [Prevotella sp.]|nr:AAA family ATPase [Prevotella sp.]